MFLIIFLCVFFFLIGIIIGWNECLTKWIHNANQEESFYIKSMDKKYKVTEVK